DFHQRTRALPHAIHFSHQFAYYTLDKDYHALIRRYQFAIGRAPRSTSGANGEAFVEGYGVSSSFDEPLASAFAGTRYCDARPPPCAADAPNGSPASFRSSMSVRAAAGLGDNVAEGCATCAQSRWWRGRHRGIRAA
ncbi:hypothetical protein B0H14DRAFT_2343309, partial [Mycena olivaceomarginata]